jgi:LacI family transcriptional regulator
MIPAGKKIALCMNLDDHYEHGIARGVVRYAKQKSDWRLYGYGWMFRPVEDLEYWRGNGIVARIESQEDARRMASLGLPVVDVAGAYTWAGFSQVNNDDYATGTKAGQYLLSCGFKRFAYCGVAGTGWSEERQKGFGDAVRARAPEIDVFEESLPWWEKLENSEHLREWLSALRRPVGIFTCNDTAGVKVTELCRKLDIHVPEEAAILGADNEDILCELSLPSLSSIELDCDAIGFRAAALLDDLIEGPGGQRGAQDRTLLIPPLEISERESTKVFASEDLLVKQAVQFIRANATSGINVLDVLGHIAASRRNLEIRFKEEMGRSLHDEIVRVRLEHAKILLRTTSLTIANVAGESGFGTLQRFHALFKEWAGTSPGSFRKTAISRN